MRLIDADALKEEAIKAQNREDTNSYINMGLARAVELIANAPTVDTTFRELVAYECGQKSVEERPKGEWVYGEDECGQDGWFCSECGFFVPWYYQYYEEDIDFIREYKACPHCLAEMVTYTGKDRDTKGGEEE